MLALLEVVELEDTRAGLWRWWLQQAAGDWYDDEAEEEEAEDEDRLNVWLPNMSSRIQRIIIMRQPKNQISTAVMVLAGGMVDLVVWIMLSMIVVIRS